MKLLIDGAVRGVNVQSEFEGRVHLKVMMMMPRLHMTSSRGEQDKQLLLLLVVIGSVNKDIRETM